MFDIAKDVFRIFGSSVKLGVLFEVVDDPEDDSNYFSHTKPVDVWLLAVEKQLPPEQVTLDFQRNNGTCITRVTKATPPELRIYEVTSFTNGFLYVYAVPTPEWAHIYAERRYDVLPVKTGRKYNFAVSLPSKASKKTLGSAVGWKE